MRGCSARIRRRCRRWSRCSSGPGSCRCRIATRLPALLAESLERGEEVTESLGRQVREAVELLAGTLDRLDRESGGRLLAGRG